jgi:hypothetical protein
MSNANNLKLDSRKRKRISECPCGKSNKDGKFVPYDGYEKHGYCHTCNETFLPKFSNEEKAVYKSKPMNTSYTPFNEISFDIFDKYRGFPLFNSEEMEDLYWRGTFDTCDFIKGLHQLIVREGNFLPRHFKYLLYRYQTTPSGNKNGVVFWQIDHLFRIRNGKIMWYNPNNCKRKNGASTVAYQEQLKDFKHSSCFFGEHLLSLYPNAKVGLVESEKTAMYMAAIYPDMIWLATGGKHGAKWTERSVFFPLIGREVMIFPDLDAHDEWLIKSKILESANVDIEVSSLLKNSSVAFQNQNPNADIMDLGIIEKWQKRNSRKRYEIIEKEWNITPPKNAAKFIRF